MLRTIFAFFLGLMLTAFVGVGVYTFHPPPQRFDKELRDLGRKEQALRDARAPNELTSADRDSLQASERRRFVPIVGVSKLGAEACGRTALQGSGRIAG